jgi:hypothetical protein
MTAENFLKWQPASFLWRDYASKVYREQSCSRVSVYRGLWTTDKKRELFSRDMGTYSFQWLHLDFFLLRTPFCTTLLFSIERLIQQITLKVLLTGLRQFLKTQRLSNWSMREFHRPKTAEDLGKLIWLLHGYLQGFNSTLEWTAQAHSSKERRGSRLSRNGWTRMIDHLHNHGYRIRCWGDTCGGIHGLAVIVIQSSGGRPNRGSALKFGAAYPLVVFFASEFFGIFL